MIITIPISLVLTMFQVPFPLNNNFFTVLKQILKMMSKSLLREIYPKELLYSGQDVFFVVKNIMRGS